jgi:proteasome-associated ATPase
MAEPKKKSGPPSPAAKPQAEGSAVPSPLSGLLPREELDTLSTLQLIDLIVSKLPQRHPAILDMVYLRERIASMEETNDEARQAIEKMDAIIEKLRSPAFRVGLFGCRFSPTRDTSASPARLRPPVDPQLPLASLQIGQRVLLNEAFAIVQGLARPERASCAH